MLVRESTRVFLLFTILCLLLSVELGAQQSGEPDWQHEVRMPMAYQFDVMGIPIPGSSLLPWRSNAVHPRARGLLLDTSERRSLVDLQGGRYEEHFGAREGYKLYGNFFHDGRFWIARVPDEGVKSVSFAKEKFGRVLSHGMFFWEMLDGSPIELIAEIPTVEQIESQEMPELLEEPIALRSILLSIEATLLREDELEKTGLPLSVAKKFTRYLPFHGMKGAYGVSYRFTSVQAKGEQIISRNHRVPLYELNLNSREASQFLSEAMQESAREGLRGMYDLIVRNCTNLAIHMLERAVPYMGGRHRALGPFIFMLDKVLNLSEVFPPLAPWGLFWRGYRRGFWSQPIRLEESDFWFEWLDEAGEPQLQSKHPCQAALIKAGS